MILHNVVQGSPEWLMARLGKPTASEFHRILTPTGKPSKQATGYMMRLLAELMLGHPIEDEVETRWMQRGEDLEFKAVEQYEFLNDVETEAVGFITNNAGTIGASPDRLVGTNGLLEIKCPAPNTQVGYLLYGNLDDAYYPQLQGQLYVVEKDWSDSFAHHPKLPPATIRGTRDEEYIAKLASALDAFVTELLEKRALLEQKYGAFPDLTPKPVEHSNMFITDEDAEEILAEIMSRK